MVQLIDKYDAVARGNPAHIRALVRAVLRLYWMRCGCTLRAVYDNNPEGPCTDWDELSDFMEQCYDGIPEIRGWRRDGEVEPWEPRDTLRNL